MNVRGIRMSSLPARRTSGCAVAEACYHLQHAARASTHPSTTSLRHCGKACVARMRRLGCTPPTPSHVLPPALQLPYDLVLGMMYLHFQKLSQVAHAARGFNRCDGRL
jgi:hypothetical protein